VESISNEDQREMSVAIRPLIPKDDMKAVLAIERQSFPQPWEIQQFQYTLEKGLGVAFVAESEGRVVGYIFFELEPERYNVINLAVTPEYRRKGVGTKLMRFIIRKLRVDRRPDLHVAVSDRNLATHLFLKDIGFRAIEVQRGFFGHGHDAYEFQFSIRPVVSSPEQVMG
jgi:[ribosomal protein S18]-alanine N-acetyltransferase